MSEYSEQLVMVDPAEIPWFDVPLVCDNCGNVTYRPSRSTDPCSWCSGSLTGGYRGEDALARWVAEQRIERGP